MLPSHTSILPRLSFPLTTRQTNNRQRTPQASKFVAPEVRPPRSQHHHINTHSTPDHAPLFSLCPQPVDQPTPTPTHPPTTHAQNRPPPLDADLALAALTTVRRGLQRWLSRIRGQWLAGHSNVPQLCEALLPPPVALVGGGGGENGREGGGKKAPVPVEKKEEDGGGGGGESDDSWDLDLG